MAEMWPNDTSIVSNNLTNAQKRYDYLVGVRDRAEAAGKWDVARKFNDAVVAQQKALSQLKSQASLPVTGPIGPPSPTPAGGSAPSSISPAASGNNISAGGGGAEPSSSPAPGLTDQDMRDTYPAWGAFLDIPEIAAIMRLSLSEGWPEEKLRGRIQATQWWRSTNSTARKWLVVEATDPATAKKQIEGATAKFQKLARDYLVPVADITAKKWATDLLSGKVGEEEIQSYLNEQATSLFPGLAAALEKGITVRQYADPYVQLAARELEVSPESIDLSDGKWNRALNTINKDGQRVSMSLSEWEATLRSDPVYGYDRTAGARQKAAQFATQLAEKFGRM